MKEESFLSSEDEIQLIFEACKDGKGSKTQRSLECLNTVLSNYKSSGGRDFSLKNIAELSENDGGVGYESLRSTKNVHFRDLIDAHAASVGTTRTRATSGSHNGPKLSESYSWIQSIDDLVIRNKVNILVAEKKVAEKNYKTAVQAANVTIDRRGIESPEGESKVALLPALSGILEDFEKDALSKLLDPKWIERNGWKLIDNPDGVSIRDTRNREIFDIDFTNALRKILRSLPD